MKSKSKNKTKKTVKKPKVVRKVKKVPALKKLKITKDMIIADIIQKYPKSRQVFAEVGLMCALCGFSGQETLEQGAAAHGFDVEKILKKLNKEAT